MHGGIGQRAERAPGAPDFCVPPRAVRVPAAASAQWWCLVDWWWCPALPLPWRAVPCVRASSSPPSVLVSFLQEGFAVVVLCCTRGDPIADALLRSARWTDRTGLSLSHHLLGQQSKLSMV